MYDCYAVSSKLAKGLMMVLIEDGVVIDDKQVFDIRYNLSKGVEIYLSKLKKSDGNIKLALEKYSGNAKDCPSSVYENIGRYMMFKEGISSERLIAKN